MADEPFDGKSPADPHHSGKLFETDNWECSQENNRELTCKRKGMETDSDGMIRERSQNKVMVGADDTDETAQKLAHLIGEDTSIEDQPHNDRMVIETTDIETIKTHDTGNKEIIIPR